MVLGILIATMTAPGLLGSQEAIRQGQSKDRKEEHRARRCNLVASCVKSSPRSREINGRPVVLRNGKLWIDTYSDNGEPFGHMYAGYYLPYPDTEYEGLVTTITDVAPIMNWVYIDRETHEAKYGVRADAQPNFTGPFDCTRQDRRLTFDGWEGWCAVEEYEGYWCLYFDVDDDGLKSKIAPGIRVLEIELSRKEKTFQKDKNARQQDQTTERAVSAKEDAPRDQSLQTDPESGRPGASKEAPPGPETTSAEDYKPETPPPAYSKVKSSKTSPALKRSNKGAVDALDDLLAMEVQAAPIRIIRPQLQSQSLSAMSQETIPHAKRIAPKLNRNSGSKAIAQAQIFEAMAATQKNKTTTRRKSGGTRVSTASSFADSASVYSEEDQRLSQEIRPQSSVSQRAFHQQTTAPPVPTIRSQNPQVQKPQGADSTQSMSPFYQEDEQPIDPVFLRTSASSDTKRGSQTSASSQRQWSSRTFAVRRPGKRVSPRSSIRKSLVDTTSSSTGKQSLSNTDTTAHLQRGKKKVINRTQTGRKTTSIFLRDLDDLVKQEAAPEMLKPNQRISASREKLLVRAERRGGVVKTGKESFRRRG